MAISFQNYFRTLKEKGNKDIPDDLHRSIMGAVARFRQWRAFLVALFSCSIAVFLFSTWQLIAYAIERDTVFFLSLIWQSAFEAIHFFEYPEVIMEYIPWHWLLILGSDSILLILFFNALRKIKSRAYAFS